MSDCEDDEEFDTSKGFDLREWLGTFSYEKSHAIQIGFALAFIAAAANNGVVLAGYLSVLLYALGVRTSPTRVTRSGDKKTDESDSQPPSGMSRQLLIEIRHKPHYYLGGGIAGDRLGYYTHLVLFETAPTHYEHLPTIIRMLVGGF